MAGSTLILVSLRKCHPHPRFSRACAGRLIRLGGKYGLRFIIVLDAYVAADYPIKGEAWFHSGYKGEYVDHLTSVVTRLRGFPEVALWQLMGERSCAPEGGTRSCYNSLVQWARVAS